MQFSKEITIGNKVVGRSNKVFIIAEAGVNHNGDISVAKELIDVASDAGADAVKFQAFRTEKLILKDVEKAPYQTQTTDSSESQFDMLKKLELSIDDNLEIKRYCREKGIIFLTTPFDEQSIDDIVEVGVDAIKVASTDLTNIPFLRKVARTNLPIILSTGMSYMAEVQQAVAAIGEINQDMVLLQCTANYPISDDEANLNVLYTYKQHFNCLLGYSDHSVGIGAAPYAIPMGASVLEKHFTLSKEDEGPDHLASLSPFELKEFVKTVRRVEKFLGSHIKQPTVSETKTRMSLQKSLVASCSIQQGDVFTEQNIVAMRTGGSGISPLYFDDVLGRNATQSYSKNQVIKI